MLLLEHVAPPQPGFWADGSQSWTWLVVQLEAQTDAFCEPERSMQHTCPERQSAVPEHFSAESWSLFCGGGHAEWHSYFALLGFT
jgi:hypothetical protein